MRSRLTDLKRKEWSGVSEWLINSSLSWKWKTKRCCLPKNAWISERASEAPGSERIERIVGTGVVDTFFLSSAGRSEEKAKI